MRWEIRYREELLELAAVGDFGSVQNVGVRLIDVAGMLSQRPVGGTCLDLQAATGTLTSLAALKLGGAVASLHVSSPIAVLMGNRYFHAAGLLSAIACRPGSAVRTFIDTSEAWGWLRSIAQSRAA